MNGYKGLTTIICVAALGLGLAACGGGSGTSGMRNTVDPGLAERIERATALNVAIEAAKATGADGTFDDTAHMVAPAVAATNDGTAATVGVTEGGMRQSGNAGGSFAEREDGPAPIAGWTGARFERGTAIERLTVYTDVGAPEAMAFTPKNLNRLNEVSGLTGAAIPETGLAVDEAYWPLVRSTSLEAAPARGSVTHGATGTSANEGLSFDGAFAGAAGGYSCSGATCSVTLDDKGGATGMGGTWSFEPDVGAMVQVPDNDHLQFGWWLQEKDDGSRDFQTFAGGTGFTVGAGTVTAAMTGSATYRGAAAGVYASVDVAGGRVTGATEGEFTAEATLTAHFFGALDDGEISGEIDSFRNMSGEPMDGWRVTLRPAALTDGRASFAGQTEATLGAGTSDNGSWEGLFHGAGGNAVNPRPGHVTGRFDAHFLGTRVAGAFGASKE